MADKINWKEIRRKSLWGALAGVIVPLALIFLDKTGVYVINSTDPVGISGILFMYQLSLLFIGASVGLIYKSLKKLIVVMLFLLLTFMLLTFSSIFPGSDLVLFLAMGSFIGAVSAIGKDNKTLIMYSLAGLMGQITALFIATLGWLLALSLVVQKNIDATVYIAAFFSTVLLGGLIWLSIGLTEEIYRIKYEDKPEAA